MLSRGRLFGAKATYETWGRNAKQWYRHRYQSHPTLLRLDENRVDDDLHGIIPALSKIPRWVSETGRGKAREPISRLVSTAVSSYGCPPDEWRMRAV